MSERDLWIAVVAFGSRRRDHFMLCAILFASQAAGGLLVLDRSHAMTGVLGRAGT